MSITSSKRAIILAVAFLVLVSLACGPVDLAEAPIVTIIEPASGTTVAVGETVQIVSSVAAPAGVDRVELSINGQVVRTDTPPTGEPTSFAVSQSWAPVAAGQVNVSVVAYDAKDNASEAATISLTVTQDSAQADESEADESPESPGADEPEAEETPIPEIITEAGCTLDAAYVADVTIPDDTELAGGSAFVKTWRIRNTGTCDWEAGYQLVFSQGDQLGGLAFVTVPALAGGAQGDVSVDLVAPAAPGSYKGRWRLRAEGGTIFGQSMTVVIIVPGPPTMTPSATPTLTPSPTGTPTVTPSATPTSGLVFTPMLTVVIPLFPYTEQVYAQVSVPAGSTGSATVACPSGTILVSGGFAGSSLPDMFIYTHSMDGNGWRAYARNDTGSSELVNAYAVCLHNAAGGTTTQVHTQVTAAANSNGHAVVACPAGSTVMGGGWATSADHALHVYNSSMSGNGWQVWARNNTGAGKLMNAYAICLSGLSGTVSQVLNSVTVPGNAANAYTSECSTGAVVGGGFAANPDLHIYSTSRQSTGQRWSVAAKNTVGADKLLFAYAMCFKRTW